MAERGLKMSVYIFNERPGNLHVDDFIFWPGDGVEMSEEKLQELKELYPNFSRAVESGDVTVYDSKKDADEIKARLEVFKYFMDLKPREMPVVKALPGEKLSLRDLTIQGARAKKRFLEDYSKVDYQM